MTELGKEHSMLVYKEWEENEEDENTTSRNSKTTEDMIEYLIERQSIGSCAEEKLNVQFYSILLPIFFYFFVSY